MKLADQDSTQQLIRLIGILSQANHVEKAERSKSAVALKYSKLMNNKSTTSGTKSPSRYFEIQALNSGLALYVLSNDGALIGKLIHEEIASLLKQIEND